MYVSYYRTVYRNQQSGYTQFYVVPAESNSHIKDGLMLCEGQIGLYLKNTPLYISGDFKGDTFIVDNEYIPYDTEENTIQLLEYISTDLTDVQMKKIAKVCDNNLFYFVEQNKSFDIIKEIVSRTKNPTYLATEIISKIKELKNQEEMTKELLCLDIGIDKIEALYKSHITLDILLKDPYILFAKYDIPIVQADQFAVQNNIYSQYSLNRLRGYVYESLQTITNLGHTCCTINQLLNTVNYRLKRKGIEETEIDMSVLNLCIQTLNKEIMYDYIDSEVYVYFVHIYEEEQKAIRNIKRLQTNKQIFSSSISVKDVEKKIGIKYNKGQEASFESLQTSGIKILTGPPGSGKTATINGLIEYFLMNNGGTIKLAATTGMAAKVMARSCKRETETVNIMLNVIPYQDTVLGKDINDPIDADLIIVDEVSMLGLQLFSILVDAVKSGSILLLVGDEDQLQSVDYGNVLHDLINSNLVEVYRLTEIIRQSGTLCENAQKINKNIHNLNTDNSFEIIKCSNKNDIIKRLTNNIKSKNYQILTPVKGSEVGTNGLNDLLQNKYPNRKLLLTYGKKKFYYGDKVIMTHTNYDRNYINGDIGYAIGSDDDALIVKFVDKTLSLDRQDLSVVDLAYAITIHKSQGSEFEEVHTILPNDYKNMLIRRILYTAVTRAKVRLCIYVQDDALDYAIDNKAEIKRMSLLNKKLILN